MYVYVCANGVQQPGVSSVVMFSTCGRTMGLYNNNLLARFMWSTHLVHALQHRVSLVLW